MGLNGPNLSEVQEDMLRCLDALYGYAMALTRHATEAEDLVQETYMQATRYCGKLRPDSNVKAWMFTIMRNRWLKQLRYANLRPELVALDDSVVEHWMVDSEQEPGRLCERLWEREEIRAALRQMPRRQREIVLLRDIEGFSYKELAEILECPVGTVMSRLSRARGKLKEILLRRRNGDWSTAISSGT